MRSQAEKLGLRSGKVVTISYRAQTNEGKMITRRKWRGTVIALYPHVFTVLVDETVTSFRYHQILGNEEVKIEIKA